MTTQVDPTGSPMRERSPFQPEVGGPSRPLRALLIAALVLVGAVAVVWRVSRSSESATAVATAAAGPASDSAHVVMLSTEAARRIGVTYAPVKLGRLDRVVRTVGIVSYDETRLKSVTARVDGWVERLHVNFTGQAVRIGDPLFSLYSPMLVSAQQELLLAKRLRGDLAAGSSDAVRGSDDLLEAARRRLLYWEVPADEVRQIEASGEIHKAITFRSPVQGVVIEKSVIGGQRIMAGETIYQIADLSTVWLDGEVFERDLRSVRLGLPVVAEFPALPGAPRTGRISYIYPTVDPETRTTRVRVELSNPGLALKPGMYATFSFAATTESVLSVPRSAVLATGKRDLVFVLRPDGMLEPREVTHGLATDDRIEIRSGLALGDTVVASATFLVDAESNLSSLLGGMGNMPGMDMSAPTSGGAPALKPPPVAGTRKDTTRRPPAGPDHSGHVMPMPEGK